MLSVLLVDDEKIIRQGMRSVLDWNALGFEIVGEAEDGEIAISMIEEFRPDVLITDIRMPFLDGIELQRYIRKNKKWIYTIVLSGYDDFSYAQAMLNLGAFAYVLKPVSVPELTNALEQIKEDYRLQKTDRNELGDLGNYLEDGTAYSAFCQKEEKTGVETAFDLSMTELADTLCFENRESIERTMDAMLCELAEKGDCSMIYTQFILASVFSNVLKMIKEARLPFEKALGAPPMERIAQVLSCSTPQSRVEKMKEVLFDIRARIDCIQDDKLSDVIGEAKLYVHRNYADSGLSLAGVARQVHMSFGYFSVIFKRETGQNFVDYLTAVRMEKARELLSVSNYKSYEIAYMVGYENPTYFSTVFKKTYGVSPANFRKNEIQ